MRNWPRYIATLKMLLIASMQLIGMAAYADKPAADPARFEGEVAGIEQRDRVAPPPEQGILFIGSSNIRKWDVQESFPGLTVTNHGFGGSHASDSVFFFDRLVVPAKPKLIVFHAGGNDLSYGRSPEQLVGDVKAFIEKTHAALPKARLIYLGPFPAPIRVGLRGQFAETARLIRAAIHGDRLVSFIDPGPALLTKSGEVQPQLYENDRLHLNKDGYALLTRFTNRAIRREFARAR